VWSERDDVERSIRELRLAEQLRAIPAEEAEALYDQLEERFATRKGCRWIWGYMRSPGASRQFIDDRAFEHLANVVPSTSDELLFFPGSDQDSVCAYSGTIGAIATVIGDCSAFEYCIFPPSIEWLVCENHHGILIAAGEPVESRLRALEDT
jgi:hypothetical protein